MYFVFIRKLKHHNHHHHNLPNKNCDINFCFKLEQYAKGLFKHAIHLERKKKKHQMTRKPVENIQLQINSIR